MSDLDRLLAGGSPGPEDRGLAALLDAVTAPGSPQELSGERAAVAGFVALRRGAEQVATPTKRSRVRGPSLARAATMKVAAAVAVLTVGGTAVAAETGSLPSPAQHHAHRLFSGLGVPPPTTPVSGAQSRSTELPAARPSPSPAASSGAGAPMPSGPATVEPDALALCREWQASSDKKDGKPMAAESRRRLITLAGGKKAKIARFCAPLLAEPPTIPTPAPTAPMSPLPSDPAGNGNGNGPKKSKDPKAAPTGGPAATTQRHRHRRR